MTNAISIVAMDEVGVGSTTDSLVLSATTFNDAREALTLYASRLLGHCVATNDLTPFNNALDRITDEGAPFVVERLASWASRGLEYIKRDKDTKHLALTSKAEKAGLPVTFTPEFVANPIAVLESKPRTTSQSTEARVLKASDIKNLIKYHKAGIELDLSDDARFAVKEAIATLATYFNV